MANKICLSMQKQFEDIIAENFPIRETVERLTKIERRVIIRKGYNQRFLEVDLYKDRFKKTYIYNLQL